MIRIPRSLVYEVMQDFYHQQYHALSEPSQSQYQPYNKLLECPGLIKSTVVSTRTISYDYHIRTLLKPLFIASPGSPSSARRAEERSWHELLPRCWAAIEEFDLSYHNLDLY